MGNKVITYLFNRKSLKPFFSRPIVYWPLIGLVATWFTKMGFAEPIVWIFWLSVCLSLGLIFEWRKNKGKKSYLFFSILILIWVIVFVKEGLRSPGVIVVAKPTPVLKEPFPMPYAETKNKILLEIRAGETIKFQDNYFGKDFLLYEVKINGHVGYVEHDSNQNIIYDRRKFIDILRSVFLLD